MHIINTKYLNKNHIPFTKQLFTEKRHRANKFD